MPASFPSTTVELAPPREPLPESFWQKHRLEIAGAAAGLLVAVVLCVWLMRRPRRPVPMPPITQARSELEALKIQPRAAWPIETARIVRQFTLRELGLPPDELTTSEMNRVLSAQNRFTAEVATLMSQFLERCDVMKFAPAAQATQADLIAEATQLIERAFNAPAKS